MKTPGKHSSWEELLKEVFKLQIPSQTSKMPFVVQETLELHHATLIAL